MATTHLVFFAPAAPEMRRVLRKLGRSDRVVACDDDLCVGQLAGLSTRARRRWLVANAGCARDSLPRWSWSQFAKLPDPLVLWLGRESGQEWCGFLGAVALLGERPCQVVDVSQLLWPERQLGKLGKYVLPPHRFGALAEVGWRDPHAAQLFDLAAPLTLDAREAAVATWQRLCQDDAPLRQLLGDTLHSLPITGLDERLLAEVPTAWCSARRVVGQMLAPAGPDPGARCMVWSRLDALLADGRVQGAESAAVDERHCDTFGDLFIGQLPTHRGTPTREDEPLHGLPRWLRRSPE